MQTEIKYVNKKMFFNIGDCTLKIILKLVNTNHKFSPESEEYRIIQSANLILLQK